jgi:hypothetical protein
MRVARNGANKGLARAGNARVHRGMIQLARRFLIFQKESALASIRGREPRSRGDNVIDSIGSRGGEPHTTVGRPIRSSAGRSNP